MPGTLSTPSAFRGRLAASAPDAVTTLPVPRPASPSRAHDAAGWRLQEPQREDTYAGIEHRRTREVTQCLKLIARPGCESIARYAFEYARRHGRRRVTCMTKDNVMKLTHGRFHRVFDETARDYPEVETEHLIIDIGTALMADQPERFDVVLTPNLYGDILSDVVAQIAGSVGLAGSANVGAECEGRTCVCRPTPKSICGFCG